MNMLAVVHAYILSPRGNSIVGYPRARPYNSTRTHGLSGRHTPATDGAAIFAPARAATDDRSSADQCGARSQRRFQSGVVVFGARSLRRHRPVLVDLHTAAASR